MNAPSVSVIIPAFRAAHTIGRAVQSVLEQTYRANEILVIDDGSPDDIAAALRPFGDRVTLVRKENGGAASARNLGIDLSSGELIAFLDADDYWEPRNLEQHAGLYQRDPDMGLTCGRFLTRAPATQERVVWRGPTMPEFDRTLRLTGQKAFEFALNAWTGTVVIPRGILENERFISGLEPAEDRDLWARLVPKASVYCLSEPLATAVLEAGSLSRSNMERDYGNMLRVIHRHRDLLGIIGTLKWSSHTHYCWAACETEPARAARRALRSIAIWPLPLDRDSLACPAARTRVLLRSTIQTVRGMFGRRRDQRADTTKAAAEQAIRNTG